MFDIDFILNDESDLGGTASGDAPVRHLALVGNALPRRCGIATFTSHVGDALRRRYPAMQLDHYAMDDGSGVEYPDNVIPIAADDDTRYCEAAQKIMSSGAEAVWLQHEIGRAHV